MSTPVASRVRWRAAHPDHLLWARYGDAVVLHHRPSAQTHFLNASTATLLQTVLRETVDAETAGRALLALHPYAGPEDYAEHFVQLLLRLEDLGLVERVSP